jgi:hypothetical protein
MHDLAQVAPAFIEMAHRIVWAGVATVDSRGRPRSRVLHPIWEWDGETLTGWIATGPTKTKRAHLAAHPHVSVNYWTPSHDTCVAECEAAWAFDLDTPQRVWDLFLNAPPPVGYDPRIVPAWTSPAADAFAALRLRPWRLRVFPGTVLMGQGGEVLVWQASAGS